MTREDFIQKIKAIEIKPAEPNKATSRLNYAAFYKVATEYAIAFNDTTLMTLLETAFIDADDWETLKMLLEQRYLNFGLEGLLDFLKYADLRDGYFKLDTCEDLSDINVDDWEEIRAEFIAEVVSKDLNKGEQSCQN